MKFINRYLAFAAILALLFSSCSKDETATSSDDPTIQSVDLTFGALLNDLANRAAEVNKDHFDQIPDCSEAEPAVARIGFSYGGNDYETDVAILSDESGYFTDYSEDLKIPVANNSSVEVTLTSFMVYDGDPDGDGALIWIAPISSEEGEFDGYVDNALPFSFDVSDGTKPYIDVEVLCYDRRMANEYGYVFFDILPEVIYPLCLFVNYCDENGRHYVADYSVDLYFGTDDTGIQLYDHLEDAAMANTGDYGEGEYYADPLCLVVPGPPANLASNQPYLYLVLYPEDWDGTGDIDNSPIGNIQLTWDMVSGLLNDDGETTEYWHLLIGECEGALTGDGTGGGGTGDNDLDDDGVPNSVDQCPNTPPDTPVTSEGCADSDEDGIADKDENEGCINDPDPQCGESTGGECEGLGGDSDEDGICDDNEIPGCENDADPNCGSEDPEFTCSFSTPVDCLTWDFDQSEATATVIGYEILDGDTLVGTLNITTTAEGDVVIDIGMEFGYLIDDVGVILDDGTEECYPDQGGTSSFNEAILGDYNEQTNVQVRLNYCPV